MLQSPVTMMDKLGKYFLADSTGFSALVLLQLNLLITVIKKSEFSQVIRAVGFNFNFLFVLPTPFKSAARETGSKVGMQNMMYFYSQSLMFLHDEVTEVFGYLIFEYKGRRNFAGTLAAWANLAGIDGHFRLHTLAGNLH